MEGAWVPESPRRGHSLTHCLETATLNRILHGRYQHFEVVIAAILN